ECPVWMAPALQEIFVIAMVCQYSRVSGLFVWLLPLALMSSASKVPIGSTTSGGRDIRRSVLAFG
ncbi:hypothetical protein, partial [Tritonibacter scottomollicae]|uniref:hypothetical protein n=1 Tax=Tritonibacter scottomollicae TaxID=483013 RepID=UPI001A9DF129